MNKGILQGFNRIKTAGASYENAVKEALFRFRQADEKAREESQVYKDAEGVYRARRAAAIANARNAVERAENAMKGAISIEVDALREELFNHFTTRPTAVFLDCLKVYSDFAIQPSKLEIEALVKMNGGNTLGLRAINKLLEKCDSKYRVEAPNSTDFENDLAALERMINGAAMYTPAEYHIDACACFGGTPRLMYRDDGSSYDGGYRWDSVSLITARTRFEKRVESLDGMAERWSNAVLPSTSQIRLYEPQKDEKGNERSPAEQFLADYAETASAAAVERAGV